MWLLRSLVSLILGTAIFVAFLGFLVAYSLTNQLLDNTFYSRTLANQDSYNSSGIIYANQNTNPYPNQNTDSGSCLRFQLYRIW